MNKYQLVLRCRGCKHRYKRTVEADDDNDLALIPNPPCPKCAKKPYRTDASELATPPLPHSGMDYATGQAPGLIGGNRIVNAIDKTADIVMKDHQLTNLRSDVRQGETMVPRLPVAQQNAADNFFGGPKTGNKRQQANMQRIMRRAIGGAYAGGAINIKSVLPDQRVALRKVGTEPISR